MTVAIEYLASQNEHGLIVLDGNPNGGTPYESLVLYVDEDGAVRVDTRTTYTSNDGVPPEVWHGRTLVFTIAQAQGGHSALCYEEIKTLLESEKVQGLLARIIDGHTVVWDGSNYVGRLTDDAEEAGDELEWLFEGAVDCGWEAWDADEWLIGVQSDEAAAAAIGLAADSDLDDIDRLVDDLYRSALADRQWIVGGQDAIRAAIVDLQQRLRESK